MNGCWIGHRSRGIAALSICLQALVVLRAASAPEAASWRGVLLAPTAATLDELQKLKRQPTQGVLLPVDGQPLEDLEAAARRIKAAGLELHYWFEIARQPALAAAHPEWMASIQGHPEWRRFFPAFPKEKENESVKVFPWVPVGYAESFNTHSNRLHQFLMRLPQPAGIWLNDLQGPPSACGCGHPLCRWTTDYGPKQTATVLGDDAAARFVRAVRVMAPAARVIPVWATECEAHDREELCAGVGCYAGRCWKEWTKQLMPLAEAAPTIGLLAIYKSLQRDQPHYGSEAAWLGKAVRSFQEMPPQRGGSAVPAERLMAIVQGWGVTEEELDAQTRHALAAGAGGVVIARAVIDQSWEPRLTPMPKKP